MHSLVAEALARRIGRNHLLQPMLTPPLPWTQVDQGIVSANDWASVLLVDHGRAVEAAQREAIAHGRMDDALEGIDCIRSPCPCRSTRQLWICGSIWECPCNHCRRWATNRRHANGPNGTNTSRLCRSETSGTPNPTTARVMAMAGQCWLPKNWDFRGRIYDVPDFCYQRDDPNRALFDLACGDSAGPDGLQYINYHLAGQADGVPFGPKKPSRLSFAESQTWAFDNREALRAVGEAALRGEWPPGELLPSTDDDVFQYIRACIEFVRADNNPNFVSHSPG